MSTSPPIVSLPSLPVPVADGGTGLTTSPITVALGGTGATTLPAAGILSQQGTTGAAGAALTGGTPTFISWTAPNDGNLHTVYAAGYIDVTSAQTGGGVQLNYTAPVAGAQTEAVISESQGSTGIASFFNGTGVIARTVSPNTTSSLSQTAAQTVGASVLYATIWGA